jgi:hypothetical protein
MGMVLWRAPRQRSGSEEDEAAWLSGCLLVPRAAAVVIAMAGTSMGVAAIEYGVSTQMMTCQLDRNATPGAGVVHGVAGRPTLSNASAAT